LKLHSGVGEDGKTDVLYSTRVSCLVECTYLISDKQYFSVRFLI